MPTQLATDIKSTAPLKADPSVAWFGCSSDTPFEWAEQRFEEKHGYKPRVTVRDGGCVKAGPIEEGV